MDDQAFFRCRCCRGLRIIGHGKCHTTVLSRTSQHFLDPGGRTGAAHCHHHRRIGLFLVKHQIAGRVDRTHISEFRSKPPGKLLKSRDGGSGSGIGISASCEDDASVLQKLFHRKRIVKSLLYALDLYPAKRRQAHTLLSQRIIIQYPVHPFLLRFLFLRYPPAPPHSSFWAWGRQIPRTQQPAPVRVRSCRRIPAA